MADYAYLDIDGLTYSVPKDPKPRKKAPPVVIVMNENCTCCSGSPVCMLQCPVDCIHMVHDAGRPVRVYVDNDICIGCMNCLSYEHRPKDVIKGNVRENADRVNKMPENEKVAVCPWNAIEVHPYADGVKRSENFYPQPQKAAEPAK